MFDAEILCCFCMPNMVVKRSVLDDERGWVSLWKCSSAMGHKCRFGTKIVWGQAQLINVAFFSCVSLCYVSLLFCWNLVVRRPPTATLTPLHPEIATQRLFGLLSWISVCFLFQALWKETTVPSCLYWNLFILATLLSNGLFSQLLICDNSK